MFNALDVFKSRLKEHITLISRYLRYIFNGHFMIAIFFAIITLAVYYQKALENLPPNFPAAFIIAIVLGIVVLYNPIQTFLKEPDKVFLLVKEEKMHAYFRYAIVYNYIVQLYVVFLTMAAITPLLTVAFPLKGIIDYLLIFVIVLILKGWNLLYNWWMLSSITNKNILFLDKLIRFFICSSFFYFMMNEQFIVGSILLLVICLFFVNNYVLFRKQAGLAWEKMIENDLHRQASFYRFVSMFAEVPQVQKRLKKRRIMTGFIEKLVPFKHTSTYDYLYRLTFIRSGDYASLYVRLTIIGVLVIIFVPNSWLVIVLAVLFLYLTSFQMISLYQHYRTSIWMDLYPTSNEMRRDAFLKWMVQLTLLQTVVFAIFILLVEDVGGFFLSLAVGTVFNYLFNYGYVKRKIAN